MLPYILTMLALDAVYTPPPPPSDGYRGGSCK